MKRIVAGKKSLPVPCLVPSISSFETQLSTLDALTIQYVLREPISLVSAYDVHGDDQFEQTCRRYKEDGGVLLLDSGGYEHSRIRRYANDGAPKWDFSDYQAVCKSQFFDLAFSYDYFWTDPEACGESEADFRYRLIGEMGEHLKFLGKDQLIPVLHVPTRDGNRRLSNDAFIEMSLDVARNCESQLIAVPERELGDGLTEKFKFTREIVSALDGRTQLHILGCGNPLSYLFLASAGADLFDGLEWYRTLVGEDFHLHHYQQGHLFPSPEQRVQNPSAQLILGEDLPYRIKVAARNLLALQAFSLDTHDALKSGKVVELAEKNFGLQAGRVLQDLMQ